MEITKLENGNLELDLKRLESQAIRLQNDAEILLKASVVLEEYGLDELRDSVKANAGTIDTMYKVSKNTVLINDEAKIKDFKEIINNYKKKELSRGEQATLLEEIRGLFGRYTANVNNDRFNRGLSRWLRKFDVVFDYSDNLESGWADLYIIGFKEELTDEEWEFYCE